MPACSTMAPAPRSASPARLVSLLVDVLGGAMPVAWTSNRAFSAACPCLTGISCRVALQARTARQMPPLTSACHALRVATLLLARPSARPASPAPPPARQGRPRTRPPSRALPARPAGTPRRLAPSSAQPGERKEGSCAVEIRAGLLLRLTCRLGAGMSIRLPPSSPPPAHFPSLLSTLPIHPTALPASSLTPPASRSATAAAPAPSLL